MISIVFSNHILIKQIHLVKKKRFTSVAMFIFRLNSRLQWEGVPAGPPATGGS